MSKTKVVASATMSLDLDALERSFDLIKPHGDELMNTFYTRLFTAAPSLAPLFAGVDLKRQKAMLMATLVLLRKSLRDLDAVVPKLHELGARHVSYGARPEHYPLVGEVLIASMAETAGHTWRAEYDHAWREALSLVSTAMRDGANRASFEAV